MTVCGENQLNEGRKEDGPWTVTTATFRSLQACLPDFVLTGREVKTDTSAPHLPLLILPFSVPLLCLREGCFCSLWGLPAPVQIEERGLPEGLGGRLCASVVGVQVCSLAREILHATRNGQKERKKTEVRVACCQPSTEVSRSSRFSDHLDSQDLRQSNVLRWPTHLQCCSKKDGVTLTALS